MMQVVHVKSNPVLPWQRAIQQEEGFFHQQSGINLRKKRVECYILSIALFGVETWTVRKVDQIYL